MIILTERLKKTSELIGETHTLADIGCDHGYLPISLMQRGKISFAYACDVKDGPLQAANKNIIKYGFSDKIITVKSDGLTGITEKKADVISVCGMGGRLIAKIISDNIEFAKKADRLILQPMTEVYFLRKFLANNGFIIKKEVLAREDDRFYNIIHAEKGENEKNDLFSLYFGCFSDDEALKLPYFEKHLRILSANLKSKAGKEDTKELEYLVENLKKTIK